MILYITATDFSRNCAQATSMICYCVWKGIKHKFSIDDSAVKAHCHNVGIPYDPYTSIAIVLEREPIAGGKHVTLCRTFDDVIDVLHDI